LSGFEEDYERQLDEARARARAAGRGDVLDYLDLRAANDRLRADGVERLIESLMALAGEANRAGAGLTLARTDAHRFRVGNSWMVGTRLVLSRGVRSLTIEAGWPRGPRDGVVRGGGLACALVEHFGRRDAGEELLLVPAGDSPRWLVIEKTGARTPLPEDRLRQHLTRLINDF
jgi:hypothetical protein